jgi:hypothetical protein
MMDFEFWILDYRFYGIGLRILKIDFEQLESCVMHRLSIIDY